MVSYLTTNEIAKLFHVRAITVYRWVKQGLIKPRQLNPKGKKLFVEEEILGLVNNNQDVICNNIKSLESCSSLEIGTKAKNIKIIKEKGGSLIPKTLVINTDFFKRLLEQNKISDPLNYNWSDFKIPASYQRTILEKIRQEFGDRPLVIRSSATCEDSPLLSFAGQYSSFLNITGAVNILKAIKLCYQSLFSENAVIYAKAKGVRLEYESMAIAIQELVPVKVAGVMFTTDPVDHDGKKMIVEYTEGLGDSIVSGHKKPTFCQIDRAQINYLKNVFLKRLSPIALKLEQVFGNPQDIEWGWDGRRIYIFQSRNITTLDKHPRMISNVFNKNKVIGAGDVACRGIASGPLKIINRAQDFGQIKKGDVVFVACKSDTSLMKKMPIINALVINGGILSHIAVIAREFNIPCLTEPILVHKFDVAVNKAIIVDATRGKILKP